MYFSSNAGKVPFWPSNLVQLEILEGDGRHRCYRGFLIPINGEGDFTDFSEVFKFIESWEKKHPDHTFILHLKPKRKKLFLRKTEETIEKLKKAGQKILEEGAFETTKEEVELDRRGAQGIEEQYGIR